MHRIIRLHLLRIGVAGFSLMLPFLATSAPGVNNEVQPPRDSVVGDYQLTGIREVGSGIRLSADGTYKFAFMAGSTDEIDEGRWSIEGSSVALKSTVSPVEPDIAFVRSEKSDVPGVRIVFEGQNAAKVPFLTYAVLESNGRRFVANEISKGYMQAKAATPPIQKIAISYVGTLRKYREFGFEPTDPTHSYFVFTSNKGNFGYVPLDNAQLRVGSDELFLKLPNTQEEIRYVRVKRKQ